MTGRKLSYRRINRSALSLWINFENFKNYPTPEGLRLLVLMEAAAALVVFNSHQFAFIDRLRYYLSLASFGLHFFFLYFLLFLQCLCKFFQIRGGRKFFWIRGEGTFKWRQNGEPKELFDSELLSEAFLIDRGGSKLCPVEVSEEGSGSESP